MTTGKLVGAVDGLWLFPVKSMQGTRLEQATVTAQGLLGDRGYALLDTETGKVVSAKSVRLFPGMLNCRADYLASPEPGKELPPVRITLADGDAVNSDSATANQRLSSFFGRDVKLARTAPDDFTIDMYHPDVEDANPKGLRDTTVEQRLGAALFDDVGLPSPVPAGSFFDLYPLTVLTHSTLDHLRALEPGADFDERRFRMNLMVDATESGFVENEWVGHALVVGETVRLGVAMPDARCVMTTLAQGDLPRDTQVLRTLVKQNRIRVGDAGSFPCCGVYAAVDRPGVVRKGDPVSLS